MLSANVLYLNSGHGLMAFWDSCLFGEGHICQINDPYQGLALFNTEYGELARRTSVISGASGNAHTFRHVHLGRLIGINYPGNVSISYNWTLDRTTTLAACINGQNVDLITDVLHTHDRNGNFRDLRFIKGKSRQEYTDLDGRLSGIVVDTTKGLGYGFDTNNRITGLTNFFNGALSQTYGYDDLDRLTSASSTGLSNQLFDYVATGNRTLHTVNGVQTINSINPANNRLMNLSGGATRSYTYKATGQIESVSGPANSERIFASGFENSPPGSTQFTYDPHNRLSDINGNGINASYKIAATDMRVEKTASGKTTRFVYGLNGQLLYEHDLNPARSSYHIYLHGQAIALIRNNTVYYVLADHLGRAEALVDQAGGTVWRANLRAFDRQVITDQIGGYQLGFPGQYHDDETGYAYNIHRDYDPGTGRYLQSDPIGLAGGLNTYGYVGGNPLSYVDPSGLASFLDCVDEGRWDWGELGNAGDDGLSTTGVFVTVANIGNTLGNILAGQTGQGMGMRSHSTSWAHRAGSSIGQSIQQAENGRSFGRTQASWSGAGKIVGRALLLPTIYEGYFNVGTILRCACTSD